MKEKVSAELIEKWLNGWSVSRGVSLSVRYKSGFKVDVGWEEQKCRFVFPVLNEDLIHLAESIEEPWVFLKSVLPVVSLQKYCLIDGPFSHKAI